MGLRFPKTKRVLLYLLGPLLVFAVAVTVQILSFTHFHVSNPAPYLVLSVIVSGFYGGFRPSFLTSLLGLIYLNYFFELNPHDYIIPGDTFRRLFNWVLTLSTVSIAIGILKSRSEAHLQRELKERRLREESLRSSEERTRAILNSANDSFVAIDSSSIIKEWNLQAEKTFGWTRQEALNKPLHELIIPPRYRQSHLQGMERFRLTGDGAIINRRIEVPALHKDGHEISTELTVYPIRQKDYLIFGAFLRDISEDIVQEKLNLLQFTITRILTEENSLKTAVPLILKTIGTSGDWSSVELWLTDRKRQNFYYADNWSPTTEMHDQFLENSRQLVCTKEKGLFPQTENATSPLCITTALKNSDYPRAEFINNMKFQTLLYCPLIDNNEVIGALCLFHTEKSTPAPLLLDTLGDVTKHLSLFVLRTWAEEDLTRLSKELEIKVQRRTEELAKVNMQLRKEAAEKQILYEQAQTANRLKDEFLATISHELRTPMNVILGHSELLYGNELDENEKQRSIEAIYRNTKAQVHIVSDILDVSKFITGRVQLNLEVVDMAEVVSSAVESIMPAASAKKIELTEKVFKEAYVFGDPTRLQQILWNLLSNAVKFTPNHGKVSISFEKNESSIVVKVTDTGKGIEPSFLPYVFERFRQEDSSTTRKFGGLGLGLSITRNLVEAHGGTIQVFSEGKNKGTTFVVSLPISSLKPPKTPLLTESEETAILKSPLEGLKILVVDDQADAQALIRTILKKAGAEPLVTSTATEAFRSLVKYRPDVLISDIGLPEKDGYELIRMIRKLPAEMGGTIKAIALTAYAHEEDHKRALDAGFDEHLAKPAEAKQLIRTVSKLTGRHVPVH